MHAHLESIDPRSLDTLGVELVTNPITADSGHLTSPFKYIQYSVAAIGYVAFTESLVVVLENILCSSYVGPSVLYGMQGGIPASKHLGPRSSFFVAILIDWRTLQNSDHSIAVQASKQSRR